MNPTTYLATKMTVDKNADECDPRLTTVRITLCKLTKFCAFQFFSKVKWK